MTTLYACLKCEHPFSIEISAREEATRLDEDRTDTCPACGQRVGLGPVQCRRCGQTFVLAYPHWHVQCNLVSGQCPACAAPYQSACIC